MDKTLPSGIKRCNYRERYSDGEVPKTDKVLKPFPIGTLMKQKFEYQDHQHEAQIYDYHHRHGGVRYSDGDWEELSEREMEECCIMTFNGDLYPQGC